MSKRRGLLVADVPGWAFDVNERDMARYLSEYDWDHMYIRDNGPWLPAKWDYDFVFAPMHQWVERFMYSRVYGSLRSQYFNPEKGDAITKKNIQSVRRCNGFHVVTQVNYRELRGAGCDNVVYLTNPVDTQRFPKQTDEKEIVACWNGNAQHASLAGADIKGFYGIVIPACSDAKIPLRVAEYNTCRLEPRDMPEFYQGASVALCASMYEGASNSVMEAMASGLAVIATDVGNHREMRDSQLGYLGDTGIILVDRTREAFAEALRKLTPERARDMGAINRQEILDRWSWESWRDRYAEFFRMGV